MKNLLIQLETKYKNRKIVSCKLLIDKEFAKLEDDIECVFFSKAYKISEKTF